MPEVATETGGVGTGIGIETGTAGPAGTEAAEAGTGEAKMTARILTLFR